MNVVPWYRKVYTGWKVQALWQTAIGFTILFAAVGVPLGIESLKRRRKRTQPQEKRPVQESLPYKVYQKRLRMREEFEEE